MPIPFKPVTLFVIILMLIAAASAGCDSATGLKGVDGKPFDLWQQVENSQATVLLFTRTDCPISNRYAPTVRSLCNTYQPRGVDWLLVYVDPKESPTTIRQHLAEYQYP